MNEQEKSYGDDMRAAIRRFIIQYATEHGYPPSFKEIGAGVGLYSTSSVHAHMKHMRAAGLIDYIDGAPRTITVPGYGFRRLKGDEQSDG